MLTGFSSGVGTPILVPSTLALAAIQLPGVVAIRDTVLPLVATLILLLIPRGLFCSCSFRLFSFASPTVAGLLTGSHGIDASR